MLSARFVNRLRSTTHCFHDLADLLRFRALPGCTRHKGTPLIRAFLISGDKECLPLAFG